MKKPNPSITVFEHESIRYDRGEKRITKDQFEALERYHGNGVPYFKLIYKGIQFNEHVGVIQIGETLIEVLPKADKKPHSKDEDNKWRSILIGMLRSVGSFDIRSTSSSNLKIKPNTILDLYFEMYLKEMEYLLHNGLFKKYRKEEGNVSALKGAFLFSKHLQKNLVHKERFFVRHTTYDVDHKIHHILYKAICLLKRINSNSDLNARIGALLLNFPEMSDIKVTSATFDKLVFNRKNLHFKKAIEIAKLLLLEYHPDVSKGKNHVLALMFDMNLLWEQFIYRTLRKKRTTGTKITAQTSKFFWKPIDGRRSSMRPDLLIETDTEKIILDTKWKNLNGYNPSPEDLRQMYVYHEYYKANRVALVYPHNEKESVVHGGNYLEIENPNEKTAKECSIILIGVHETIKIWQEEICKVLLRPRLDSNQ